MVHLKFVSNFNYHSSQCPSSLRVPRNPLPKAIEKVSAGRDAETLH